MGWSQASGNILGGTDNTKVGNTLDRLKTDAGADPVPVINILYQLNPFTNAGSQAMDVNGSVTPVNFSWAPSGSGEVWYVEEVSLLLYNGSGTFPVGGFANLTSPLTNGLALHAVQTGTDHTIVTVKTNMDVVLAYRNDGFQSGTNNLLGSTTLYAGAIHFDEPLVLKQANSDSIYFKVQDNLSTVGQVQAWVRAWRAF